MWNIGGRAGFAVQTFNVWRYGMRRAFLVIAATAIGLTMYAPSIAGAASITDDWDSVKAPPAPLLKPVTVDPKTTALLMLDFMNQNCGKRDRCLAQVPAMKKLLETGRTDLLAGFVSKKNRKFKAFLVKGPEGKIVFEFQPRAPKEPKPEKPGEKPALRG